MWRAAQLREAALLIHAGGLVAYPTEGVYGLGCDPLDRGAVIRLCELKQRPLQAGLILLAADLEQLPGWINPDEQEWRNLTSATKRPTTWVVRAGPLSGNWITGGRPDVAVRLSGHAPATALCRAVGGPIISTSANRRGRRPAPDARTVRHAFGRDIEMVLGGETGGWAGPSDIRVAATGATLRSA